MTNKLELSDKNLISAMIKQFSEQLKTYFKQIKEKATSKNLKKKKNKKRRHKEKPEILELKN